MCACGSLRTRVCEQQSRCECAGTAASMSAPHSVPRERVCEHTCVPVCQMSQCHSVAAGIHLAEDGSVCVYTCMWHVCRHRQAVHAGPSDCALLGPHTESWHIWSAMWGLGHWGNAQMLLCNAKPQVTLMPLTPPVLPMPLVPPVSPSSLREHGPGSVQVIPVQGQVEGNTVQLIEATQDLCSLFGAQEGATGVVPLAANT